MNEQLTDVPIILQDIKKEMIRLELLLSLIKKIQKEIISDFKELLKLKDKLKDELKIFKDDDKYLHINLRNVNDLIGEIKKKCCKNR